MENKLLPNTTQIPNYEFTDFGWIYIIKSGSYYKIGKTKNIIGRLKTHQVSSPFDLEIIHKKELFNHPAIEESLHNIFSKKRTRSEWFNLDKNDLNFLKLYMETINA